MHTVLFNEVDILLVLQLIEQFDFILRRILQNFILVFDHGEVAFLLAFGLIDPLHAEDLFIKASLY
jgi:hypothetical protein